MSSSLSNAVDTLSRKTLGILQAGRAPEEMIGQHPDYNELFVQLLGPDSFNYRTWAVLDDEFPASLDEADAWLITGSRHGAYEMHSWIAPLEQLIRDIYAKGAPMVGICFGHQIIAQALGGTVEKYAEGWSVGRVDYALDTATWGNNTTALTPLMAFHQDQVIDPPAGSITVGSSDFCRHAALMYDNRILTIQPHPEFDQKFVKGLLDVRADILPEDILKKAQQTLYEPLARDPIATALRGFLDRSAS